MRLNPMRRSLVSLTAVLALVAGLAGPAAANATGLFTAGTAIVGKNATFCNHDGQSDPSGAGLGLPGLTEPKQAFYALRNVTLTVVNDLTKGAKAGVSTGTLNVCGRLRWIGKVSSGTGVGAACGLHKGYHGKGRIEWLTGPKVPTGDYYLHDITWKADVLGTIVFWASGQQGAIGKGESGTDLVTGVVNAQGGLACMSKHFDSFGQPRDKDPNNEFHGATVFTVSGEFQVLNDMWRDPQSPGVGTLDSPGICKNTGNPLCAYDTKKPQTPKQG